MSEKPLRNIYDLLNLKPFEEFLVGESTIKYRFDPEGVRQWYNESQKAWVADNDEYSLIITIYDVIILKGLIEVYGPINHILKHYKNDERCGCNIMFEKNDKYISFYRFWFDFFNRFPDCKEFKVISSEDSVWGLCIKGVKNYDELLLASY